MSIHDLMLNETEQQLIEMLIARESLRSEDKCFLRHYVAKGHNGAEAMKATEKELGHTAFNNNSAGMRAHIITKRLRPIIDMIKKAQNALVLARTGAQIEKDSRMAENKKLYESLDPKAGTSDKPATYEPIRKLDKDTLIALASQDIYLANQLNTMFALSCLFSDVEGGIQKDGKVIFKSVTLQEGIKASDHVDTCMQALSLNKQLLVQQQTRLKLINNQNPKRNHPTKTV